MSQFEIITITLSFILGLGVTQILSSLITLIRARREVQLDWMPLAWAWSFFAFHIQFWFAAFAWEQCCVWSPTSYVVWLLLAVFLFLGGGLVLPTGRRRLPSRLVDDFELDGHLALAAMGAFMVLGIWMNSLGYMQSGSTLTRALTIPYNLAVYVLFPPLVVAAVSRKGRVRRIATVIFVGLQLYSLGFVWARPIA